MGDIQTVEENIENYAKRNACRLYIEDRLLERSIVLGDPIAELEVEDRVR